MKVLLSRWQFGVTITYHFLFVPLTIGLALLVAVMQVLAYVKKDETWGRLSRFFGTLFLINFAMGVVTGIVQEFQFGMNWSNYSVFVGNIFGAPLAMEGLLAFFAESTFIGLWLFGRNRLPALVHTVSICVVSLATIVSAFWSPEQPVLFPASLRANLRLGAPQATDREMTGAARQVRARAVAGPAGTRPGHGACAVGTSGLRRRIAAAQPGPGGVDRPPGARTRRAHLDQATAGAVLEAVLEHARGRSVLWVTHRPAELALFPDVRHLRGGMT